MSKQLHEVTELNEDQRELLVDLVRSEMSAMADGMSDEEETYGMADANEVERYNELADLVGLSHWRQSHNHPTGEVK